MLKYLEEKKNIALFHILTVIIAFVSFAAMYVVGEVVDTFAATLAKLNLQAAT